jgi:hypothetical protein
VVSTCTIPNSFNWFNIEKELTVELDDGIIYLLGEYRYPFIEAYTYGGITHYLLGFEVTLITHITIQLLVERGYATLNTFDDYLLIGDTVPSKTLKKISFTDEKNNSLRWEYPNCKMVVIQDRPINEMKKIRLLFSSMTSARKNNKLIEA